MTVSSRAVLGSTFKFSHIKTMDVFATMHQYKAREASTEGLCSYVSVVATILLADTFSARDSFRITLRVGDLSPRSS